MDSLVEIITATGSQKFYKPIQVYSMTNTIGEIEVSMIFLVVTFFCGQVIKRKRTFS